MQSEIVGKLKWSGSIVIENLQSIVLRNSARVGDNEVVVHNA